MSSLIHKTQSWVSKGLITPQQAEEIIAFEQNKRPFLSLFSIILFLGVFSIACGIVAIISSNWYNIPATVKLAGMFAALIGMGSALPMIEKKYPVGFDAGLFFFMLLFFAAIGLVGQIYHLKSDTYKAFLFWSGLAFPLLFLTKRVLFGWIWEVIFICAFWASPWGESVLRFIEDYFLSSPLYFSFLFFALFFVLSRVQKAALFVSPLRVGLFVFGLFFLFCGRHRFGIYNVSTTSLMALFCATAIAFASFVWNFSGFNLQEKQSLWIVTGLYVLFFLLPLGKDTIYFSELILLLAFIFVAYCFHQEKKARILAVITAFRMLIAFFDLFGSLLYTGFGLIFSGVVMLGLAYACYKADGYLKQKLAAGGNGHE